MPDGLTQMACMSLKVVHCFVTSPFMCSNVSLTVMLFYFPADLQEIHDLPGLCAALHSLRHSVL